MPAPEAILLVQSHEDPLYEGTNFTLVCTIFVNKTGVDIEFYVQGTLSGSEELPIEKSTVVNMTADTDLYISFDLIFYPLTRNDTGAYECTAAAHSSSFPYAISSDTVRNTSVISVGRK